MTVPSGSLTENFNPLAPRESETILALYFLLSYVNFNPRFPWGKRIEQPG